MAGRKALPRLRIRSIGLPMVTLDELTTEYRSLRRRVGDISSGLTTVTKRGLLSLRITRTGVHSRVRFSGIILDARRTTSSGLVLLRK